VSGAPRGRLSCESQRSERDSNPRRDGPGLWYYAGALPLSHRRQIWTRRPGLPAIAEGCRPTTFAFRLWMIDGVDTHSMLHF
jgi:hypothetical protein